MSAHDFDGRTGEGSDRANAPPGWGLIRLASLLVPAERRADWRAEWRAELASAAADAAERGDSPPGTRMRLVLRAMASTADAVSLSSLSIRKSSSAKSGTIFKSIPLVNALILYSLWIS
jgi:hypothetical protein